MPSTSKILRELNPEQHRAVTAASGPVLVLAGAGTGKTRVITVRIAHLMDRGVPATGILAVTFTNKAAREMRERLTRIVGENRAGEVTLGTFHRFCMDLLRIHGERVGLGKRFTICDTGDQLTTIRGVLREIRIGDASMKPSAILSRISLAKNRLLSPKALLEAADSERDELVAHVWERYDAQLRRTRSVDFDDLLLLTLRLLAEHGKVLAALQQRYQHVLVDEYQDTNGPQYEIVHRIAQGHRNLCVVGDDDQSIYGWRGADVSKILGFSDDYPDATVVRLETNYRSTEQILDAANFVIRNNPDRHEKTLRSALGPGDSPRIQRCEDEEEEAEFVVKDLLRHTRDHVDEDRRPERLGDIAILFRTAVQTRTFEAALRASQVPYILVGGPSFFDRKEIRDVLAYIRLLVNPSDEVSLLRVVAAPPRGLGKTSVDKLLNWAAEQGVSGSEAFDRAAEVPGLSATAIRAATELRGTLSALGQRDPGPRLVSHLQRLVAEVGYKAEIERCYPDEATRNERWLAVEEIFNFAENYVGRASKPSLRGFLDRLALTANDDQTAEDSSHRDAVTLMTLHAAKGLEYPRVYLVGCEEGLLPHQRAVDEDTVGEERRLMYVGITRARLQLIMTWSASRARHGARAGSMPSRFLFEVTAAEPPDAWQAAAPRDTEAAPRTRKKASKRRTRGGPGRGRPAGG